jgi:hypothetical protein
MMTLPKTQIPTLLGLLLISFPPSQSNAGDVYWTDRRSGQMGVRRMGLDGAAPTTTPALLAVSGDPRGIAIDVAAGKLYFANGTSILQANLNGTGSTVIVSGQSGLRDLRLERSNDHLYWCDETGIAPGGGNTGAIRRTSLQTFVVDAVEWKVAPGAYYMDIFEHPTQAKIFWGNITNSYFTTALTGGSTNDGAWLSTGSGVRGICVDDAARMVYWCERDAKAVFRAPMLPNASVPDLTAKVTLFSGLDTPHGLALDVKARRIYWTDTGTNSGTGAGDSGISRGWMDPPFGGREILLAATNAAAPPRNVFASQAWDLDLDLRTPTFAGWQARYFLTADSSAVKSYSADPDGDGRSNLLEFAHGTNPRMTEPPAVTVIVQSVAEGGRIVLTYPRRKNMSGAQIYPQLSTDLVTWLDDVDGDPPVPYFEEVSVSPLPGDDDMETVTVTSSISLASSQRLFVRTKVK